MTDPGHGRALARVAGLIQAGDLETAERAVRAVLRDLPEHPDALHYLGLIRRRRGFLDEGIALLRQAHAAAPDAGPIAFNLGNALRAAGRREEALACFGRAAAIDPADGRARNNMAMVLLETGQFEKAEEAAAAAVKADPRSPKAHNNLGNARYHRGRFAAADAAYAAALELKPDYAKALSNRSHTRRELKDLDAAAELARRAVLTDPDYPKAHNALACVLLEREDIDGAAGAVRKALALQPRYPEGLVTLSNVLRRDGRFDEAERAARDALALAPGMTDARIVLGLALRDTEDFAGAAAAFRAALAERPDSPDAKIGLAMTLNNLGRRDEAEPLLRDALATDPDRCDGWRSLVESITIADPEQPEMRRLRALWASENLTETNRIELAFALGKACEDLADFPAALVWYREGNDRKRATLDYDVADDVARLERVRAAFDRETMDRLAGGGDPDPLPIFILGMPRSGTTLAEQILAAHPAVHGGGERSDLGRLVSLAHLPGLPDAAFPDWVSALRPPHCAQIGRAYLDALRPLAPAAERITDKMPANFVFVPLIRLVLPGATIVHCRRDARDTCVSCYSKLFTRGQEFSYDLADLAAYHTAYREMTAAWEALLPDGAVFAHDYEALVADPEPAVRRLLDHCGLPFDETCLRFFEHDRPVHTASLHQVRKPFYTTSVGRWRRFGDGLAPLLDGLGTGG